MAIKDCKIIKLPKFSDSRGNLTFIEKSTLIPFDIRRVYYLYQVPKNSQRGAHGHIELEQLVIAINGSFDIELDDASNKKSYHLDSPDQGLYITNGIWRDIKSFSDNAVCLVLASLIYNENDYIRNYDEFLKLMKK